MDQQREQLAGRSDSEIGGLADHMLASVFEPANGPPAGGSKGLEEGLEGGLEGGLKGDLKVHLNFDLIYSSTARNRNVL